MPSQKRGLGSVKSLTEIGEYHPICDTTPSHFSHKTDAGRKKKKNTWCESVKILFAEHISISFCNI